jgi:polysaccharide pyruvyl transferase WcaK-like protein
MKGSYENLTISIMGWYGNDNAGDEAVLSGILEHIKAIPNMPNINIFSDNPNQTSYIK